MSTNTDKQQTRLIKHDGVSFLEEFTTSKEFNLVADLNTRKIFNKSGKLTEIDKIILKEFSQ